MLLDKPNVAIAARLVLASLALSQTFCGNSLSPTPTGSSQGTLDSTVNGADKAPTHVETDANNLIELAEPIDMVVQPQVISGDISDGNDIDVYDLGPVEPGDHVQVAVDAEFSLQAAVALLDANGDELLINDHRNVYMGRNGPFIDVVVQRAAPSCFVAIASTPSFNSSGGYVLTASYTPGVSIPDTRPDEVLLDFAGGRSVKIGTRPPVDVPAFDAASIDRSFTGTTEVMMAEVVAVVRRHYEGLNVRVLSTSEGDDGGPGISRIHFGTFDAALLGVAATVDEFNSEPGQHAIVFTDTFAAFMTLKPTVAEMAQALANVASHEIGHLEGLVHTGNPEDIMDVTASLRELIADQVFQSSPIYSAVFPIGKQNSVQYLLDSVGGDPQVLARKAQERESSRKLTVAGLQAPRAREMLTLSTCGIEPEGCYHRK